MWIDLDRGQRFGKRGQTVVQTWPAWRAVVLLRAACRETGIPPEPLAALRWADVSNLGAASCPRRIEFVGEQAMAVPMLTPQRVYLRPALIGYALRAKHALQQAHEFESGLRPNDTAMMVFPGPADGDWTRKALRDAARLSTRAKAPRRSPIF